jgi:hypothetical protein
LHKDVPIKLGGKAIKVSPRTAAMAALLVKGMSGDAAALEAFLNHSDKMRKSEPANNAIMKIVRWIVRPRTCDVALLDLGVFKQVDGACRLDLWVLREALKRNPSPDLTGQDLSALVAPFENRAAAEALLRPYVRS